MKKNQVHLKSFAFKKKNRPFQFLLTDTSAISADWYRLGLTGLLMAIALVFSANIYTLHAQDTQTNRVWKTVSESQLTRSGDRYTIPSKFRPLQINPSEMRQLLAQAPMEPSGNLRKAKGLTFFMPMPDGTFQRFNVFEYYVIHPDLAARYPEIKTYTGQGIDDPSATIKLDMTPLGFHAMVLSPNGNIFIDPYCKNNTTDYMCYDKKKLQHTSSFDCETSGDDAHLRELIGNNSGNSGQRTSGTYLKKYRLALACTGEFAGIYNNRAATLGAMAVIISRVSGVFEAEVAIRLELVVNTDSLIFTDPSTDPYINDNKDTMKYQNQLVCDSIIGSANYDIGHVLSTTYGGRGAVGSVCMDNTKARGVSGHTVPTQDPFMIDLVAHEIGHQFGAHHSFNSSYTTPDAGCLGQRDADYAHEPGSGITIMSYAGLCDYDNLAQNKIPYFHGGSFDDIITFTTTGSRSSCPEIIITGNTAPVVTNMGAQKSIPISTPFVLTGAAIDADGDPLTYSWDDYDLGGACPWTFQSTNAPMFRSFEPSVSPSRTFPQISDIINNTTSNGELLPNQSRTLEFKLTVRDNNGGVMHPDSTLKIFVVNSGGAFRVTAPDIPVSWTAGTLQNVAWNVSGTNNAPISTTNVKISLSTDGGSTFAIVLLASTPNDGLETITVPNSFTTKARIKVEAVGNIFFDISNEDFIIAPSPVLSAITTSVSATNYCVGEALNVSFTTNTQTQANPGNIFTVQLSNSTGSFAAIPATIGTLPTTLTNGTISCTIPAGIATGNGYRIRVKSSSPQVDGSDNGTNISISEYIPAAGSISGPNTVCKGTSVTFSISPLSNATSYSWTVLSGATIISGNGTNTIQVMFGQSALSGKIVVYGSNANCNSASSDLYITLNSSPAPTITGGTSVCSGSSTTLTANVVPTGTYTYQWSTVPTQTTSSISVSTAGTYTVTVTNSNGCTGTVSVVTTVNAKPIPSITGNSAICSGVSATLSANTVYSSYLWSKNGSTLSTAQSINVNSAGTYILTVTNSSGCTGTASKTITSGTNPTPSITGNNAVLCSGSSITLSANAVYSSYQWSKNQLSISSAQTINVTSGGTYVLTVTNSSGCSGSVSTTVSAFTAQINPGTYVICQGVGPVTFSAAANIAGSYSYQWKNNGIQVGNNSPTYSTSQASNNYTVVITMNGSCSAISSPSSLVINSNPPTPIVTPSGPVTLCSGSVVLTSNTLAGTTLQWRKNSSNIQSATNPSYTVTSPGLYSVVRTATTTCSSTSAGVQVNSCRLAGEGDEIPEKSAMTITPNPFSETATVTIPGDVDLKNASLDVYNVLGEKVKTIFVDQPQVILTTEKLEPGVYLLRLNSEKSASPVTKFVIQ